MPRLIPFRRAALVALMVPALLAAPALVPSAAAQQRVLIAYSDLVQEAERGQVADIRVAGNTITATFVSGAIFTAYAPNDPGLVDRFIGRGVRISGVADASHGPSTPSAVMVLGISIAGNAILALLLWLLVGRPLRVAAAALQTIAKHAGSPVAPPGPGAR